MGYTNALAGDQGPPPAYAPDSQAAPQAIPVAQAVPMAQPVPMNQMAMVGQPGDQIVQVPENYCGPMSMLVGLCGCFWAGPFGLCILFCPIDQRVTTYVNGQPVAVQG